MTIENQYLNLIYLPEKTDDKAAHSFDHVNMFAFGILSSKIKSNLTTTSR